MTAHFKVGKMDAFFEALEAANLTRYQYAAWFVPVSWLPTDAPTDQGEPLLTLERNDVARVFNIETRDQLGQAMLASSHIDSKTAAVIDAGPGDEICWLQWEITATSVQDRANLIARFQTEAPKNGWSMLNSLVHATDTNNPRFICQFLATGFHAALRAVRQLCTDRNISLQIWQN
ncbi:MAG: hypothetical protein ACRD3W_32000 [Terriglobales bacterium]